MKVLLDTCVIVDVLQGRTPFCEQANEIFILAANNVFTGCISAKSVTDIYYLTHRLTHDDKATRDILDKLFSLFEVLDTGGVDCKKAIPSPVSDYEDAVMIETALRFKMNCIVTRNEADFAKSPLSVYTPHEFLTKLRSL